MVKKLTCIECPMGCDIEVQIENGKILSVTGNTCPRGKLYAENEMICPKRVLTTTVKSECGKPVPVKTDAPVNKADTFILMEKINKIRVKLPISIGDVIVQNISNGANLIATANLT